MTERGYAMQVANATRLLFQAKFHEQCDSAFPNGFLLELQPLSKAVYFCHNVLRYDSAARVQEKLPKTVKLLPGHRPAAPQNLTQYPFTFESAGAFKQEALVPEQHQQNISVDRQG